MPQIDPLVEALGDLVVWVSVTAADLHEMCSSGTLPRDSIHLAVMIRLGLTAIASDDEGFDNRPSIDLFMP